MDELIVFMVGWRGKFSINFVGLKQHNVLANLECYPGTPSSNISACISNLELGDVTVSYIVACHNIHSFKRTKKCMALIVYYNSMWKNRTVNLTCILKSPWSISLIEQSEVMSAKYQQVALE